MDNLIKAMLILRPEGGWVFNGGEFEAIDEGVTIPSQEEIDVAVAKVEANELILQQLNELDKIVTRKKEDKAVELGVSLDPVEQAVVDEKASLRAKLQ